MHCNNLRLVWGLGLVGVSSRLRVRIRVKVKVSVMIRVSSRTSWVVNFALFRCYRPVIYTRPMSFGHDSYTYKKSRSLGSWVKHVEPDRRKEPIPLTSSLTLSVKLHLSCQKLTASLIYCMETNKTRKWIKRTKTQRLCCEDELITKSGGRASYVKGLIRWVPVNKHY